jgi:hypothetical protein
MNEHAPRPSLDGCSIVACGTLRREMRRLADTGFLDSGRMFFTAPGLHEWPKQLEKQLVRQARKARALSERVIVVYGEKCYLDFDAGVDTDALLARLGKEYTRVRATNCVDMLADAETRDRIAGGAKVYWLTPGWLEHWDYIFKDWDAAMANETFPAHDKAVVLDAVDYFDEISGTDPERILRICDWMKLEIEPYVASLERLKRLLCECAQRSEEDPVRRSGR